MMSPKVISSPTAGMRAMTNRLRSKPPMVSTFVILSVRACAVSSSSFIHFSMPEKAPPRCMPSFQVVSVVVMGMETNISAKATMMSHHGDDNLLSPKACIRFSLRVM